ncbi:hypothetical protein [Mesorhizobium sp. M0151]|uniref:hypothetical protein n=1 Tax=Mesorhizobium sp. M0151 TaxID=2956897 RepID=UPI0033395ADA
MSLMPLILAAFAVYLRYLIEHPEPSKEFPPLGFWEVLSTTLFNGQLLFYAMSFVAAVVWYSSADLKRDFPLRIYFWLISLAFCVVCATVIGIDPTSNKIAIGPVKVTSIVVYLTSAVLYLLILMFRQLDPADVDRDFRDGEDETERSLRELRESAK